MSSITKRQVRQVKSSKTARFEARMSSEMKALCQRAACIQGRSLTDFILNSAYEAANRTVHESELITLTERDRAVFVEALLNPAKPNAALRRAAKRHAEVFAR